MADSRPVFTLLLAPSAPFAAKLLREGPCGARPPEAVRYHLGAGGQGGEAAGLVRWYPADTQTRAVVAERALVLVWAGAPVPEGCDRLRRHTGRHPSTTYAIADLPGGAPGVWSEARELEARGLGRVIALAEDGAEVER